MKFCGETMQVVRQLVCLSGATLSLFWQAQRVVLRLRRMKLCGSCLLFRGYTVTIWQAQRVSVLGP
jgi:hypothetical protein